MCNGNTGMIIEFLVFGGGGLLVLLGFIIKDLITKKKAERRRAEERARQEQIANDAKKREQMEKLNKQKRIEDFKNKIKEIKKLYDAIRSWALYHFYPKIENMPYRDHSDSIRVSVGGISSRYGGLLFGFDINNLPNLKKEQLDDFCVAVLQLTQEIILEKDNSLQLSISVKSYLNSAEGSLSYKGKPIEGSW